MNPAPRVLFRERQRLRAEDLRAEQEYLLGLEGRHYVGPHEWGIVRGLAVSVDKDKRIVTVAPGLAIDGYGRELAVFQPVQLGNQQKAVKQYVYLYYCERPQGWCGDAPNPRWRDSAEIALSFEPWPMPDGEPNLIDARAAGSVPEAPAWPVLLGTIDRGTDGEFIVDLSESRFTRLRGARVASPSGHAVMRVGQENLADEYHFCIAGRTPQGIMQDRLAIDRDGNSVFWGNVIITGSTLAALIATQIQGLSIKIIAKKPAGTDILWRALLGTNRSKPTIELSFRDKADPDLRNIEKQRFALNQGLVAALAAFNRKSKLVTLSKIGKVQQPRAKSGARDQDTTISDDSAAYVILDDRESTMDYEEGALSFTPEETSNAPSKRCGCTDLLETPKRLPQGFVFQAGPAVPVPPSRDIFCLHVKPENQAPSEELRVSGGAFQEGDFSSRFTIGGFANSKFQALLTVRGNGTVELVGEGQRDASQRLYPMVQATGSVQLPPIKPDPRDQIFNYLLVLAYIYGVLSPSSSLIKIAFPNPPLFIETAQNWSYKLSLQNLSVKAAKPQNTAEIIVGGGQALPRTIANATLPQEIGPQATATVTVPHTPQDIPKGASSLVIQLSLAMRAGDTIIGGKGESLAIPVLQSPVIDLSQLTDPIQKGSNFQITIKNQNQSGQSLTLNDIKVTGLGPQQSPSLPVPPRIAPGTSGTTGSVSVPAQAVPQTTVKVTISYKWDDAVAPVSLSASKTVTIT